MHYDTDYVVIGSGFGGSVSAYRLTEKGYRVWVLEKGRRFAPEDFPKRNWNVRKWLWWPRMGCRGFFRISLFRHVTVLAGVGVGGGSLVYANTLPHPKPEFFRQGSWAGLRDWQSDLEAHYKNALKMLGASANPVLQAGDKALQTLAEQMGLADRFGSTQVAVYFGDPDKQTPDPYFGGRGPARKGCNFCGGCMVGCRYDAKNTLDKNYLYLAEKMGAKVLPEREVLGIHPLNAANGEDGYLLKWRSTRPGNRESGEIRSRSVVLAGGVLGTVPLLLKLKKSSLPRLSEMVGRNVRTNSESLVGVTVPDKKANFSEGVAIGSILHFDEHSHLEPVRYPEGSGFWRLLMAPMVAGGSVPVRLAQIIKDYLRHPVQNIKTYFVRDWARQTQILLFMRTLDSTLQFKLGPLGLTSSMEEGAAPSAFVPEAKAYAEAYAKIVGGKPTVLLTETLMGIPTTAHILGGAVMGDSPEKGVIDADNRVFGYKNMLVCDGSMISANPGVNPALSITAISERAMSLIPPKEA